MDLNAISANFWIQDRGATLSCGIDAMAKSTGNGATKRNGKWRKMKGIK